MALVQQQEWHAAYKNHALTIHTQIDPLGAFVEDLA